MTRLLILTFFCLSFLASKSQVQTDLFETDDDGITVEKFDSLNKDENRFNQDNKIYKVDKKYTFSYYYEDQKGIRYLMTKGSSLNNHNTYDWKFEKADKKDSNSIFQIILSVRPGLHPFVQHLPDYNQTIIGYNYTLVNGKFWSSEMTGVIENEKNIWMHPPRTDFFKILELNPFPYIKAPYKIGNKWSWKLKFGSHWADKRWLLWEGSHENVYSYEITDKLTLLTKLGNLDCFIIKSSASSSLGQTKLVSYFNMAYGFIKLDYTNIDGTKTVIELEKVE